MKLCKPTWINHDGHPIFSIDIHPDDSRFATGGQGEDSTGRVVIWNLKAVFSRERDPSVPKVFCQLDHHSACVNCVRWSNSGKYLASGGDDKVIIIWKLVSKHSGTSGNISNAFGKSNLEVWKSQSVLRCHEGDVLDLAWSSDDTYLASCSVDNTVIIWNAQNFPQVITTLRGHTSMVKGVTWDPIGKYVATQSEDKTLRIWRTSDWTTEHIVKEPFNECGGTTHVLRLGWSPDGLYLLSAHAMNCGGPTAQIIEREGWKTDKDFVGHRKAVVCVRFNKSILEHNRIKQCCVALGSRDRSISVWSTALKRPVCVVKEAFTHSVMDLTWSHCGKIMMACSWDGSVMVFEFTANEIGRSLTQDETASLYQKFYGESIGVNYTQSVIPNIEVFLARKSIKTTCSDKEAEKHIEEKRVSPEKKIEVVSMDKERLNKGPTKQIETRTADGKRRITPKFLPISEDVCNSTVLRDDAVIFQSQIQETPSSQNQDNLRESMVSTIDDVSFDGSRKTSKAETIKSSIESAGTGIQNNCVKSAVKSPVISEDTEKLKLDSNLNETFHVVENGVQNSGDSSSEKKTENVQKKRVALISVPHEGTNGLGGVTAGKEVKEESRDSPNRAITNGCIQDTQQKNFNGPDYKTPEPSSHTSSNGVHSLNDSNVRTNKDNTSTPTIPLNRKRKPSEEMKPPLSASKKRMLIHQPSGSSLNIKSNKSEAGNTAGGSELKLPVNKSIVPSKQVGSGTSTNKSGPAFKSRLAPMKIDSISCIQVSTKPESSYTLEVKNKNVRTNGVCHELRCKHFATSFDGLEWTICTDAPICGFAGDIHRIVAVCEDATLHIIDLKGRYAISPILLSSYPSKMVLHGAFLLIITTKACLHMWNIHTKKVIIKSESLLPLLNQPGNDSGDKNIDVVHAFVAVGGVPAVSLSNSKSFIFNADLCTWTLFTDGSGLVSSPLMPESGDVTSILSLPFAAARRKKPAPAVLSHIKLQLIKATEMKKAESIKHWILAMAKAFASHGLDKELHLLCEDLLGPTHSISPSTSWDPTIAGCVDKRSTLREILTVLLEDLNWQNLYAEFDELLSFVESKITSKGLDS